MSRIRTTLDSVTKAVGSTDLISKFSRLKPGSAAVDGTHAGKALAKNENVASKVTAATCPPPEEAMNEEGEPTTEEKEPHKRCQEVEEKPFVSSKKPASGLAANASAPSSSPAVAKQTMQLFHPAGLSTNMDETYKTLAEHINSYFGTSTQAEEGPNTQMQQHGGQKEAVPEPTFSTVKQTTGDRILNLSPAAAAKSVEKPAISTPIPSPSDRPPAGAPDVPAIENTAQPIPAPATSSRKGFTHYLSYPRPSVQAFVGSYIAPLVPKFRGDTKGVSAEKDKSSVVALEEPVVEKAGEKAESEEEKTKRQLLTQREKVRC